MPMVLAWSAPSAAADVLLFMNEPNAHGRWRRRRGKRRAVEQQLARVAAQIERSEPYRASLGRVLKLGDDFQRTLSEPQRASWLALEDALLEHTERVQRAYFLAGVEVGKRPLAPRSKSTRGPVRRADERAELLSMLARLIVALARR